MSASLTHFSPFCCSTGSYDFLCNTPHFAIPELQNPVCRLKLRPVVRHNQHAHALCPESRKEPQKIGRALPVQIRGRLIREQELRCGHERSCKQHAFCLSAGQFRGTGIPEGKRTGPVEQSRSAVIEFSALCPVSRKHGRERNILHGRQRFEQPG